MIANDTPQPFRRPMLTALGHELLKVIERTFGHFSVHGDRTFFDVADFPWVAAVEREFKTIRTELEAVLDRPELIPAFQEISPDQATLTQDRGWKTFFFYGYGFRANENCARCPGTTRVLEAIPGMKTAFFSILEPGKRLPPHRGPYKGVLRYHLALAVPEPQERCGIRVGGDVRHWTEGRSLVFDDTFPHEAWNDTQGVRVVLFVDVVRPMRFPLDRLNNLFLALIARSSFIRNAQKKYEEWTERVAAAEAGRGRASPVA